MVRDDLHTVGFIIAVDLHKSWLDKLAEHIRGQEGRDLAAPVVVVEQCVRFDVFAELSRVVQLKLRDAVDQLVHFVRIFIESDETLLHAHQMVAHFKNAGCIERGRELLVPVDLFRFGDERLPFFGVVDDLRHLHIILPVLDVLDNDLVRRVNRERARRADGPGAGFAPCVNDIFLAVFGITAAYTEGRTEQKGKCLILVDKAVGMSAMDGFQKILAFAQHKKIPLFNAVFIWVNAGFS